ncbi:hypothetical protein ACFQYP_02380 [Nonomuraea antimicrobica]
MKSTADLAGTDISDIGFTKVSCATTGYNGIVVSNAYRVSFRDIDFGNTSGAGSFVIFTRLVRDSHLSGIRGGDTNRRMIFFDANVRNCSVRDFHFGATLGSAADGRAIHCAGPSNTFADGSVAHRNSAAPEAVFVTAANVTVSGLEVRESTGTFVLNGAPAAEGLTLTGSHFASAGAAAFRVKGPRTVIHHNRFDVAGAPFAGRFEGPDNQCVGNTIAGTGEQRLIVTTGASALIAMNTFGAGSKIKFDGGTLYAGACFGNTGLDGIAPNHLPMGGGALHVDGGGRLRVKPTPFTSDTDGTVVGTQT